MRWIAMGGLLAGAALVTSGALAEDRAPRSPSTRDDLTELVERVRAKSDLPAMGAAIVVGERLAAVGVSGVRQRGKDARATVEDLWHLGSCTKAMTATLVARLVEREQLAWDLTLEKAFPDLEGIDDGFKPVTLELLLANRGGAPDQLVGTPLWPILQKREGTHREQRRTLLEWVISRPPVNEPGSTYLYSNAGFAIAGAAAERKLDTAWEDLLRKEVLEPLGMKSGGFGPPGTRETLDQPRGHMANGVPVPPGKSADNPPALGPAGTVHATIGDWAKFVSAHLVGETVDSGKGAYLQRETFLRLHRPLEGQRYAFGWLSLSRAWAGPSHEYAGKVLTHAGSNTMWYCVTWVAPKRGFAVLVTCNQGGQVAQQAADELAGKLIRRHLESAAKKR